MRIAPFKRSKFALLLIALLMLVTALGPTGSVYADPSGPLSGDVTDIPKPDGSADDTSLDPQAQGEVALPEGEATDIPKPELATSDAVADTSSTGELPELVGEAIEQGKPELAADASADALAEAESPLPEGAATDEPKPDASGPGDTIDLPAPEAAPAAIEPQVFSIGLTVSKTHPSVNEGFLLTATTNQDVGPTPFFIQIWLGGTRFANCGAGTSCSVNLSGPAAGAVYNFQARVSLFDGGGIQALSNVVTVRILPPWSLSLSVNNAFPAVGQTFTLTANANQDVGPTPYYIQIFLGGTRYASCGSGTSCSVNLSGPAAGAVYNFQARVSNFDGSNLRVFSNIATVRVLAPWRVSLSVNNAFPTVGQTFTLTANANQDVGPTPFFIQIWLGGTRFANCGAGTSCSVNLSGPAAGAVYNFQARISNFNGSGVQALSNIATVRVLAPWRISLSTNNSFPRVNQRFTLTANVNQDVGPTPYFIQIYRGGRLWASCGSGTRCAVRLFSSAPGTFVYQARISLSNGSNVQALSRTVRVTVRR